VPSHIYTADNIRKQNPCIEKIVSDDIQAYMAGANGPDTTNIMSYTFPLKKMGAESHYEKTGDLPIVMLMNAGDDKEQRAYAIGWMTHWINDYYIHALINQWGGWFAKDDKRHKTLEMLESKYVYANKNILSYDPEKIPGYVTDTGRIAVFNAFKTCFPDKETYKYSTAQADFLLGFFRATEVIKWASGSFKNAAEDGTGVHSAYTTWLVFPKMPSEKQYQDIQKFAEVTDTHINNKTLTVKIKLYDNKLHKWFLKQWDEAQTSATQYSIKVCEAATGYLNSKDPAKKKEYLDELHKVLPNVSIDQPLGDKYDNDKIYPGNVRATEVYYECEITDNTNGGNKVKVQSGTVPINLWMNGAFVKEANQDNINGFDGADTGEVTLEIPTDSDLYKYDLKVSFRGKEPLKDPGLKDYAWVGVNGYFGAEVKIDGDKTTKAAVPLKLRAIVNSDSNITPKVKLHWSNETSKKKLGDDRSISFVSYETGKFVVKAQAYIIEDGREVVIGESTVEVEVTDPDVTLKIDGENSVEPGKPLKLKANITTDPIIKKALEIRWSDDTGQKSYGKTETITFTEKQPGSYSIHAEAYWKPNPNKDAIRVGDDTKTITVGSGQVSIRIDGDKTTTPGQPIQLTAVLEGLKDSDKTGMEYIWNDVTRKMSLGKGIKSQFSADDPGTYKITVEAVKKTGGNLKTIAQTEHKIEIKKDTSIITGVTADLEGVRSEVVAGGSANISATNFRSGSERLVTIENDSTLPYLKAKWQKDNQQKNPGVASKDLPQRPNKWGVDTFKIVWNASPKTTFTPNETTNNDKTSIIASGKPGTEVTVWGDILQGKAGKFVKVGETAKANFTIGKAVLSVNLEATKTTLKPGEIADVLAKVNESGITLPLKYQWTGEYGGGSADQGKVSFVSRKSGPYVLSVEVTDAKGLKGTASITLNVLGITAALQGLPDSIIYGQKAPVSVKVDGLDKVVGASRDIKTSARKEQWVLTEVKTEDTGETDPYYTVNRAESSVSVDYSSRPCKVTVSWTAPPKAVKPGESIGIPWTLDRNAKLADDNIASDMYGGIEIGKDAYYESSKGTNQGYGENEFSEVGTGAPILSDKRTGTYKFTFPEGLPGKTISIPLKAKVAEPNDGERIVASSVKTYVYTFGSDKPVENTPNLQVIWESEPPITFTPSTSQDLKTIARFDRMNNVKVWAIIQVMEDGAYQTIGETPQVEVNVVAPNFDIVFDPVQGKGKIGKEIKATVKTTPAVEDSLINYVWSSPESSNRMQYQPNAGVIGFKLKNANPLDLTCTAKVPTIGEEIGTFSGTFSASPYSVKAQVVGTSGPRPQVWKEGVGLVDIPKGSYASDEIVRVKATVEGSPAPSGVNYEWTVNEGTTIASGESSEEVAITRHETGTAEATVEAMDKDGVFLGRAKAAFQVTVSADDLKKKEPVKLNVTLQAFRKELGLKESVDVSATAIGGKAPYKYTWTGVTKPNGSSAAFTASKVGMNTISVTVTDSNNNTGSASITVDVYDSNLVLKLKSDKPELTVFDTANLSATVTGGKAPYVIKWGLGVKGTAAKAMYTPTAPGAMKVTATVTDANKKTASATLPIKVLPAKLRIDGLLKSVVFGKQLKLRAIASLKLVGKNPVYVWFVNKPVRISRPASGNPENNICMNVIGTAKIGVQLCVGNQIVGYSPDYMVEVTVPKLTLSIQPSKPKVGDTVTVSAATSEDVDAKLVRWRWMQPKAGVSGNTISFKLQDEQSITAVVELAEASNGQTISSSRLTVTPLKSVTNKQNEGNDISDALDAINAPLDSNESQDITGNDKTSSDKQPVTDLGKPIKVVSIMNTSNCQFTDTAVFKLDKAVNVTQIMLWYCWNEGEEVVTYTLSHNNKVIRTARFDKGDTDIYQKQWGNAVDEPMMNLEAGTYVVKTVRKQIGQNSGTGGNGMITVVTGGYLVPPDTFVRTSPVVTKEKPVGVTGSRKQIQKPVNKPASKPKVSSVTSSASEKLSVTFYNGDSQPLHMFMKSEGFNQGNKTPPFGLHIEDYQVKPGSTIVFCAGRDGKVLYTGTYKVPSKVDGISVNYKPGQGLSFGED